MSAMQPLEIFRPGQHVAMSGESVTVTADDLAFCASAYDPKKHDAPIVIGHPLHDSPAYGWVAKLSFHDGSLWAHPEKVDTAFAEMVNAGRYKKISPAFYPKGARANPVPSGLYLRHVGALGGMPPSVKGMQDAAFADHGADVLAFGEHSGWEAALRAREEALQQSELDLFFGEMVKQGRLTPAELPGIRALALSLSAPQAQVLEFAETVGGTVRKTGLDTLKDFLRRRHPVIHFGEAAPADGGPEPGALPVRVPRGWDMSADGVETLKRIQQHMTANGCDYTTAMRAVCGC